MRKIIALAIVASLALPLAACEDEHAGEHCTQSHQESGVRPVTVVGAKGQVSTALVPYSEVVCDRWEPNDELTVKP